MRLHELSATDVVRGVRAGDFSAVEIVQSLLDHIAATDARVEAWETLDAEGALAAARHLDAKRAERFSDSLLFGLPVGIKDVFHVRGLPTTCNFDPYRGRAAAEDSGVVRHLREAGAIILGKTVTVQFAWSREPNKTHNPWNYDRTPGGSSSGSGAAVGARHAPAAIGTQTGGSNLRPASYCGVAGMKPTFGRLSRYGLFPVSHTLDHPGIIVRSVADCGLLLQALAQHDPRDPYSVKQKSEDFVSAAREPGAAPRLGLVRDLLDRAMPEVRDAAENAAERLAKEGADVREVRLPVSMDELLAVHAVIIICEGSAVHAEQHVRHADSYLPGIRANIEIGQLVPSSVYLHASRLRRRFRTAVTELVAGFDGLIGPTTPNLPPAQNTSTGDPTFQAIWTLFGFPNITLPTGLSQERLPFGLQIVGQHFRERDLLRVAAWCENVFGRLPAPF